MDMSLLFATPRGSSSRRRDPRSKARLFAFLTALALVMVACAADEDPGALDDEPATEAPQEAPVEEPESDTEDAPDEEPDDTAGEPEMSEIVVATIPIMAMAPFFHARDAGYFADEGLEVEWQIGSGGAALIPRVLGGEIHIFFSALEPFLVARSEGVEIDLVAQAHTYEVIDGDAMGLYTLPDSGLETVADLEGATIAVNTLNSIGHVYTLSAIAHQGIDVESIRWVEIGFPEMAPALERGEVDAAWTPDPFATIMKNNLDAFPLLDPTADDEIMADLPAFRDAPGGAWAATSDFIAENPNTVAAFERGLRRANLEIHNDHALGVEVMVANTDSNPDILSIAQWPAWSEEMTLVDRLQVRADLMIEFEMLEDIGDVSSFVHSTAR